MEIKYEDWCKSEVGRIEKTFDAAKKDETNPNLTLSYKELYTKHIQLAQDYLELAKTADHVTPLKCSIDRILNALIMFPYRKYDEIVGEDIKSNERKN